MKKILITMLMLGLGVSVCLAQGTPAGSAAKVPPAQVAAAKENKQVSGKLESVTMADPAKGTKSEIVVAEDSGQKITLLVKSTTTIYGADWKATALDKLNKDELVKVKYSVTPEGVNEVLSVSVVK